ncbi:MAG TPA: lamin tail domain-containing protein [Candidatus Bathyarchaeia archaeon]|nr:lamin tail domain-containing protein [Candidatus Bathyarchaeia archaeon]
MKTTSRVIIEHINHNPPGKDTFDKLNEEFVVLQNEGTEEVTLAGWTLTDETATGARKHVYKFPQAISLSSREKAYVHTGPGKDSFDRGNPSKWTLHWGRHSFVWNNEGDTATLFDAEGNKVDSLEVVTIKVT